LDFVGVTNRFLRPSAFGLEGIFVLRVHNAGSRSGLAFVRSSFDCGAGWRTASFGKITVIFVPLPRELTIFNSPPISWTRSRIHGEANTMMPFADSESVTIVTEFQT
jgi:hypothetical protein